MHDSWGSQKTVRAASPEQNARPDVAPRHEHIGTKRECTENAPERYRDPPKIITGLTKNLAEGQEMEPDHNSGQYRSQIRAVNDVSDHTENCDCREFQNNYDNKLLSHPLCPWVG